MSPPINACSVASVPSTSASEASVGVTCRILIVVRSGRYALVVSVDRKVTVLARTPREFDVFAVSGGGDRFGQVATD